MQPMARIFSPKHRSIILRYAGKKEQENLFVIGAFQRKGDAFEDILFAGAYREVQMIGLGAFFKKFGSLVLHAENNRALTEMVDQFVDRGCRIEWVPMFARFALPTIARLRRYGYTPKELREETVFLLTKKAFTDHPEPGVRRGTPKDVDEIITLRRMANGEDLTEEITPRERSQIYPETEYLLHKDGKLVSCVNVHGWSEKYVQIGGVATHPDYRERGFAKQVISAVSRDYLAKNKHVILFCKNDNVPALAVYEKLGFRPIDQFIVAKF